MFDHRISIEDKLRDFCLLSLSLSLVPLLPQFAKYKTEMTTISQHYVARGALVCSVLSAQLEIITRGARTNVHNQGSWRGGESQDTPGLVLITAPTYY